MIKLGDFTNAKSKVFSHGAIEIQQNGDVPFYVNGQCIKHYIGNIEEIKVCMDLSLDKV